MVRKVYNCLLFSLLWCFLLQAQSPSDSLTKGLQMEERQDYQKAAKFYKQSLFATLKKVAEEALVQRQYKKSLAYFQMALKVTDVSRQKAYVHKKISQILQKESNKKLLPRKILAKITGDFPKGELIDPEVVTLGGKDVRNNLFLPGIYTLYIEQPGYVSVKRRIKIEADKRPYVIAEELKTTLRSVAIKIAYDVPPADSTPAELTIASLQKPEQKYVLKHGATVKPGSYALHVEKKGYETLVVKKHVWPSDGIWRIQETLRAKLRDVFVSISADKAFKIYPKVLLREVQKDFSQTVTNGKRVKPGKYFLDIVCPGYVFGQTKLIYIEPSEHSFLIKEKLLYQGKDVPTKRMISFDLTDEITGEVVRAHEVLLNGKKVASHRTFAPGFTGELTAKFKNYKTVNHKITIPKGTGVYIVSLPLQKLKSYHFNSRKKQLVLNGIAYPYAFYVQGKRVEEHHIVVERGVGRWYYQVKIAPFSKTMDVFAGYYFQTRQIKRYGSLKSLRNIDIDQLLVHLKRMAKEKSSAASLSALQKLLAKHRTTEYFKTLSKNNLMKLRKYVKQTFSSNETKEILEMLDNMNK